MFKKTHNKQYYKLDFSRIITVKNNYQKQRKYDLLASVK
jgi:hypothetical protein